MLAHRQQSSVRAVRSLPVAALVAVALSVTACGSDDPMAPMDQETPVEQPASLDVTGALVTSQRIVFTSYRNGQYDIYKMDPAGQNVLRLTNSPTQEGEAAFSFDNKRVALVRPRVNAANQTWRDIYIVNADGSNGHWARSTAPTNFELSHPTWSPDGSKLAVSMSLNGVNYVAYLILATGQLGAYSTGYGGLPGTWPTYTKSGQIVYLGPTRKTVNRINGDGSGNKILFSSTQAMFQPTLSPDGTKLLFGRMVDEVLLNSDIFVRNQSTGAITRLTNSPGPDMMPTWSPDGSRIAFMSGRTGIGQVWTMSPTGGNLTRVTQTTTAEGGPSWSH
jgi:Tol biopolymer transport system component